MTIDLIKFPSWGSTADTLWPRHATAMWGNTNLGSLEVSAMEVAYSIKSGDQPRDIVEHGSTRWMTPIQFIRLVLGCERQ